MPTARLRTAGVVGAVALLLGGCGGGVEGTPVAELWDPCSIPSDALRAVGIDPDRPIPGDTAEESHRVAAFCSYANGWFDFTTYSFETPVESRLSTAQLQDRIELGERAAVRYRTGDPPGPAMCAMAVNVVDGSIEFEVRTGLGQTSQEDPCGVLERTARVLIGYVPN
ncbi:DUF3558 family protein [Rhodococcoides corynebacterioides]|uniref:DUF3558 family protein n=1 Tax=Rhodococcoides corynebacterioides TaxID=53972 RepID=UPI003F7E3905